MGGLSVSSIVNVSVTLTPAGAQGLSFGTLMIAGDSNVINGLQRFRSYTSLASVASDFGLSAPEYLAADLFFEQVPAPTTLMIGRWLASNTAAQNVGAVLSASQQALANWTSIGSGGFDINIDGSAVNLSGLNFTAVTNLNGVASVITAALSGGQTCVWTGSNFVITSGTTGAGVYASGTVTFTGNPSNNDTLTLGGTQITFVTGTPTGNEVQIGSSANQTAANLQLFLQASLDTNIVKCSYSTALNILTITYKLIGTSGNSFSLTKSSTSITLSGSDLAGGQVPSSVGYATTGAGTDISAQLGLTSALSQMLVPGYNAESPVACAEALANISTAWYGLMFSATTSISSPQSLAVSSFIEGTGGSIPRIHGVTTSDPNTLVSTSTSDLAYLMQQEGFNRSFIQFSSTTAHAVASLFGRAFTVDYTGTNVVIDLMFKQEPDVVAETLTQSQANTLQAKQCNVFINYINNTSIIQYGNVSSEIPIYIIQGLDAFANGIQTSCYNVLYTSPTKIPQTDAGVNQLTNAITGVCQQFVGNGLLAGGTWNAPGFGSLVQGQYLKAGYYIYATPIALQSESQRITGAAPPIQVAAKLAGSVRSADILVSVNQ